MAHEVQTMAYRNTATPWHGLGNALPAGRSIEEWQKAAGMNWELLESPVMYAVTARGGVSYHTNPEAKVLFRSDTHKALSVVSDRYHVVQPKEVLEFYRDLVEVGGFQLETAGVLKEGRRLWALARTGESFALRGNDRVDSYLLIATSCDGSLATQVFFSSIRVVCSNTLHLALKDRTGGVSIKHSTRFDAAAVKKELGIHVTAWDVFTQNIKELAARPVSEMEARKYLVNVLGDPDVDAKDQPKQLHVAYDLFSGRGRGSDLASAKNTAWGLVNAVTEYVDFERRARSPDNRLDSAWFGIGASIKEKAMTEALALL